MKKYLVATSCFLVLSIPLLSQNGNNKDTVILNAEQTKQLLDQIGMDSAYFLKKASMEACDCIDSVNRIENDKKKKVEGFSACIDDQVTGYQMAFELYKSMTGGRKDNVMNIAVDKNDWQYKSHYYQIERWLMDSCRSLKQAIASNDEAKEKSYSDDPKALEEYDKGVELLKKEKYAECIPFFEKAVSIDPEFAFAWDNLGICYRRTGNLEKAESAYKSSLKVDPSGKTALQNLAVVYQMQKRDDDAINAYKEILKHYPGDPEVYYGIALVYYNNKKDWENSLENMCKAYNIYIEQKSPYRSDAEQVINMIYGQMKKENKEEKFFKILKDNNIKSN